MRFRFTIRDLLWLTALLAVCIAWWVDHRHAAAKYADLEFSASFEKSRLMEMYDAKLRGIREFEELRKDAESRDRQEAK
jgi:hypothetical protein